jgi:hypothetical protein
MFVALNSWATDYVIVRNNEQTVIYQTTTSSNGNVYLAVFPLTNPSVNMLTQIGLPSYLWGRLNLSDGIYDTRLDECQQQLVAANAQLEDDKTYIQELENKAKLFKVLFIAIGVISGIVIFIMTMNLREHMR